MSQMPTFSYCVSLGTQLSRAPRTQRFCSFVKRVLVTSVVGLNACTGPALIQESTAWPDNFPAYDHIVIVIEENKDWNQVIGRNDVAPYLNGVLAEQGASLNRMYGEEHHSQGNYFWLFSGSNQGVGFRDAVPPAKLNASNLAQQLIAAGKTFKGYSESLPQRGYEGVQYEHYYRKHAPWISFGNIPTGDQDNTVNVPFRDFPADYNALPTVSFVIPNVQNDMHDVHDIGVNASIRKGDDWLKQNLSGYYEWAKSHNSLLVVTFDENNHEEYAGLTDPAASVQGWRNQVATIIAGAHVKAGYRSDARVTHVNILRTIEAMHRLGKSGKQQANAVNAGISDDFLITDVFKPDPNPKKTPGAAIRQ